MRLDQLLNDIDRYSLIELFGGAALAAVEAALSEKNAKPYVRCLVRDKPVQAKREDLVRQLWLQRLTLHYRYSAICAPTAPQRRSRPSNPTRPAAPPGTCAQAT